MTLIIAAQGEDFIIVGSDGLSTYSETSVGTSVCVETVKWYGVSDHVVILGAGDGNLNHALVNSFKNSLTRGDDGVTNITDKFINFCRFSFNHTRNFHFEENTFPGCIFIIAGLDKDGDSYKIPKTCVTMSYDDFMLRSDDLGYKIEGKPMIARYLFKKYYEKVKSSADELLSLVAGTLDDIIEVARDGGVGKPISLLKIDNQGILEFDDNAITLATTNWKVYTNWKSLI